jgi:hypothetical protein
MLANIDKTDPIILGMLAFQLITLLHCWFNKKKLSFIKKFISTLLIIVLSIFGCLIYFLIYLLSSSKATPPQRTRRKKSIKNKATENDDIFDARINALTTEFGEIKNVLQAGIPFQLGYDAGGLPNIYFFENHIEGLVSITGNLIGEKQPPSDAGNYELMLITKDKNDFLIQLLQNLSFYTMDASINSGDTMDLPLYNQIDTNICAVIFDCYKHFKISNKKCGVMVMIGITQEELDFRNQHGGSQLLNELKKSKIYPYFDVNRESVV